MKSILVLLSVAFVSTAFAKDTLIVDIYDTKPMVYADETPPSGFDVDLWVAAVNRLDTVPVYKFNRISAFQDLFPRAAQGVSDVAFAGITITSKREESVDFSHTYFKSGLAMLIRDEKETGFIPALRTYVRVLVRLLPLLLGYFVYLLMASGLILWFERSNQQMFPHFFDAAYWVNTVISSTGFGDKTAISRKGKILAQILMFTGIGFLFPMLTGTVTAELSAQRQEYSVKGPEHLKGKRVAVEKGTTSADAIKKYGAVSMPVTDMNQAAAMLITRQVDVVVADYPLLTHLSKTIPGLVVIQQMFEPQDYGFMMPPGSTLREPLNRALLAVKEDGTYDKIYAKYFGEK